MRESVAYLRVSDVSQVAGSGFDRQEETIRNFSKKNGFTIAKFFREAHTGAESDRPIFSRMVEELLGNHCRIIIVESLDRFARDLLVQSSLLALLIRHKISLFGALTGENITENYEKDPVSRSLIQIMGSISELEKNLINRRLQSSRNRKSAEMGRRVEGRKPFGYYEGEKEIVQKIFKLHRKPRGEKRLGFYRIARILNEKGIPTRTGKPWTGGTIAGIIRREKG